MMARAKIIIWTIVGIFGFLIIAIIASLSFWINA